MSKFKDFSFPSQFGMVGGYFNKKNSYECKRPQGGKDWLLIYTVDGSGRFALEGSHFDTKPGDVVLIRPGVPQHYGLEPKKLHWELRWSHFLPKGEWMDYMHWPARLTGHYTLHIKDKLLQDRIVARLSDLVRIAQKPGLHKEALALNALEAILLRLDEINPNHKEGKRDHRIKRAQEYITANYQHPLPLSDMAKISGLSVSRFAHLFKDEVGQTPQQFIETQRLARARDLLIYTDDPVNEIGELVGFDNPFYFSQRFKKFTTLSPRAFRKAHT